MDIPNAASAYPGQGFFHRQPKRPFTWNLPGVKQDWREVRVPESLQGQPISDEQLEFVRDAKNWCQPDQDTLLPLLQANGFQTAEQQAANRRKALLRAAAIDPMMIGDERRRYATEYGLPNAIRALWWVRRHFGRAVFDG